MSIEPAIAWCATTSVGVSAPEFITSAICVPVSIAIVWPAARAFRIRSLPIVVEFVDSRIRDDQFRGTDLPPASSFRLPSAATRFAAASFMAVNPRALHVRVMNLSSIGGIMSNAQITHVSDRDAR